MKRVLVALALAGCASHPMPRPLATETLTSATVAPSEPARLPSRPLVEADVELEGFHVHVLPAAQAHPRIEELLHALEVQLGGLVASFPQGMRTELVRAAIEIEDVDAMLAELDGGRTESLATAVAAGWLSARHPENRPRAVRPGRLRDRRARMAGEVTT